MFYKLLGCQFEVDLSKLLPARPFLHLSWETLVPFGASVRSSGRIQSWVSSHGSTKSNKNVFPRQFFQTMLNFKLTDCQTLRSLKIHPFSYIFPMCNPRQARQPTFQKAKVLKVVLISSEEHENAWQVAKRCQHKTWRYTLKTPSLLIALTNRPNMLHWLPLCLFPLL